MQFQVKKTQHLNFSEPSQDLVLQADRLVAPDRHEHARLHHGVPHVRGLRGVQEQEQGRGRLGQRIQLDATGKIHDALVKAAGTRQGRDGTY